MSTVFLLCKFATRKCYPLDQGIHFNSVLFLFFQELMGIWSLLDWMGQILDEMPVFYGLGPTEKREILVCVLHILRYLDDASLVKAWQQNMARTRLFFKLLEECQELLEVRTHSI